MRTDELIEIRIVETEIGKPLVEMEGTRAALLGLARALEFTAVEGLVAGAVLLDGTPVCLKLRERVEAVSGIG